MGTSQIAVSAGRKTDARLSRGSCSDREPRCQKPKYTHGVLLCTLHRLYITLQSTPRAFGFHPSNPLPNSFIYSNLLKLKPWEQIGVVSMVKTAGNIERGEQERFGMNLCARGHCIEALHDVYMDLIHCCLSTWQSGTTCAGETSMFTLYLPHSLESNAKVKLISLESHFDYTA